MQSSLTASNSTTRDAAKLFRLIDSLDEHDDVNEVAADFEVRTRRWRPSNRRYFFLLCLSAFSWRLIRKLLSMVPEAGINL